MKKAVLFLTFNRLAVVQKSFEAIRRAKPPRFYVASDGARQSVEGEKEKVEQVRKWILDNIDWDCEVKTRFLKENSGGCANGVSSAVTWFFENEEDGIILEDDCIANQSFFTFCEELLDKYKDDKRVWHISGDGFYDDKNAKGSYYFAKIMHCWGWASWADRWKHFKLDLKDYDKKYLKNFSKRKEVQKYWSNILTDSRNGGIDSWAYPWAFWIIANNGFCINPYKNLVSNIGVEGVHYSADNPLLNMKTYEIEKNIHPKKVEFNQKAIGKIYKNIYKIKKDKFRFIKRKKDGDMRKITILGFIKILRREKQKLSEDEMVFEKYKSSKRFVKKRVNFKGRNFIVPDLPSFAYQIKDIFIDGCYKFNPKSKTPLIYDCGANIGTSVLFFKKFCPNCRIKAFEADSKIFEVLKENTGDLPGVELFEKAVWINSDELSFSSEGADGGSLLNDNFDTHQKVKAVRLKELLQKEKEIDFLKMDIEGAEVDVIVDCADELKNVKNVFVEYHSIVNQPQRFDELLKTLKDAGFRYHTENISHQISPLQKISIYNNMDLQVNVFGYRS